MATYEMNWDCSRCGTERLLGKTHRHCPNCGSPQDPGSRYFPPEDEKVAVEDHVFVGADVSCGSCDTPNSAAASFCTNCGSPMESGSTVSLQGEVEAGTQSGAKAQASRAPDPPVSSGGAGAAAGMGLFGMGCMGFMGLCIVAMTLFCCLSMCWTSTAELTLTHATWERSIQIERLENVKDDGWCDKMPAGARETRRVQKKKSSKKVRDGETCKTVNVDNGDGTFKQRKDCKPKYRSEPVMADHCTWNVVRWKTTRTASETGGKDRTPTWPRVTVDGCKQLGCTREGKRETLYVLQLRDGAGNVHRCPVAQSLWSSAKSGSAWTGTVRKLSGQLVCSSVSPL